MVTTVTSSGKGVGQLGGCRVAFRVRNPKRLVTSDGAFAGPTPIH